MHVVIFCSVQDHRKCQLRWSFILSYFLYSEINKYFTKLNYGVSLSFCSPFQFETQNINIEKKRKTLLHLRWFCSYRYQHFVSARPSFVSVTYDGLAHNSPKMSLTIVLHSPQDLQLNDCRY